jgi:hypothetical protein
VYSKWMNEYKAKIRQLYVIRDIRDYHSKASSVQSHVPGIRRFVIHVVFLDVIHGGCPRHLD